MTYRFVSFNKKISSKGNVYAKLVCLGDHDYNRGEVYESFIYEPLISDFESLGVNFGDMIDIFCDLKGISAFNGIINSKAGSE